MPNSICIVICLVIYTQGLLTTIYRAEISRDIERHYWEQIVSQIKILTDGASECHFHKIPEVAHKCSIIYCTILIIFFCYTSIVIGYSLVVIFVHVISLF